MTQLLFHTLRLKYDRSSPRLVSGISRYVWVLSRSEKTVKQFIFSMLCSYLLHLCYFRLSPDKKTCISWSKMNTEQNNSPVCRSFRWSSTGGDCMKNHSEPFVLMKMSLSFFLADLSHELRLIDSCLTTSRPLYSFIIIHYRNQLIYICLALLYRWANNKRQQS